MQDELREALAHPSARPKGSRLLTVASGKGGVGKTWLAVTLAHAFARAGERVLLFDGDLGLANVDVQLGLMPATDLGSVITGHVELADAIEMFDRGGFHIIAGRSGSGLLAGLGNQALAGLKADIVTLSRHYDRLVLDLGAGIELPVQVLSDHPGVILVVLTDEPTSLTDAYAFIKVIKMRNPRADIRVVVNMASTKKAGERAFEALSKACTSFLEFQPRLAGVIHRDRKVVDAIRHQTPILTRHPLTAAAADAEAICQSLRARA